MPATLPQDACEARARSLRKSARWHARAHIRVATVSRDLRRVVAALLAGAALCVPATARAQTTTVPAEGVEVVPTPPVPLTRNASLSASSSELPNTGTDPRMLFLGGLALTLIGFGLRLRTADADDY
jgi:LPXTG-motif cell wall-anchored protein